MKHPLLTHDESEYLNDIIDSVFADDPNIANGPATDKAHRILEARVGSGDRMAMIVQSKLSRSGMLSRVTRHRQEQRRVVFVPDRGPVSFMARPAQSDTTGLVQRSLFIDLPWEQAEAEAAAWAAAADKMEAKAAAYARIMSLRAHYPDTMTPREAFVLAGIDPNDEVWVIPAPAGLTAIEEGSPDARTTR